MESLDTFRAHVRVRFLSEVDPLCDDLQEDEVENLIADDVATDVAIDSLRAALLEPVIVPPTRETRLYLRAMNIAPQNETFVTRARSGRRPLLSEHE